MSNLSSQRIDVIIQLQKMIEMMSRSQGASIKEICNELECNERTFYRRKDDLEKMDVPLFCRGDPDAATNGKRWFIDKNYTQDSVQIYLTPVEKLLLRKLIYKKNYNSDIEKTLCEKINKAILLDTNDHNFQIAETEFDNSEIIDNIKTLSIVTNALEQKRLLKISAYYTEGQILGFDKEYSIYENFFAPYLFVQQNEELFIIGKFYPTKKIEEIETNCTGLICAIYVNSLGKTEKIADYKIQIPQDFDSDFWIQKLFAKNDETTIVFNAEQSIVNDFLRKKWFDFIDVNYLYDRQVFTLKSKNLEKAKEKILSYGSKIKVLAPQSFAIEIQNELNKAQEQYSPKELMPEWTCKNEITYKQDDNLISFGKHKTNNALYRYYKTWWRQIISLHEEPLYSSIFSFNNLELKSPIGPMYLEGEISENKNPLIFTAVIPYENQVFIEYALKKEISGDFDWLPNAWNVFTDPWWDDNNKCGLRYILNRNEKMLPFAQNYKKNGPTILLTGIDYIDPEIAKEITTTGMYKCVPCAALVLKNIPNIDEETCTIKSYFYYKKSLKE